jgi:hypothetical protein
MATTSPTCIVGSPNRVGQSAPTASWRSAARRSRWPWCRGQERRCPGVTRPRAPRARG